MGQGKRQLRMRVDGVTRFLLASVCALLTLLVIGLWADTGPRTRQAAAGEAFVDAGAQRKAILEAQEKTNQKLDELIRLFKSGEAKVRTGAPSGEADGRTEGNAEKEKGK